MSYLEDAREDASRVAKDHVDVIARKLVEYDDLTEIYEFDEDRVYQDLDLGLLEAAQLLDELSEYTETDSGLWESLEPRQAVVCQAHYTYGNAVEGQFRRLMKSLEKFARGDDVCVFLLEKAVEDESAVDKLAVLLGEYLEDE